MFKERLHTWSKQRVREKRKGEEGGRGEDSQKGERWEVAWEAQSREEEG